MIPAQNNPKWREFVTGTKTYNLSNLAVKMLAARLKLQTTQDKTEDSIKNCINEAYDFFKQNESSTDGDIKVIFG